MDIRPAERVEDLVQQLPQDGFPLRGLHPEAHRAVKRAAMARHIEFGNQRHAPFPAVGVQLAHLVLRIKLSRLAQHAFRSIELRIPLAFQPPGLVLCQVQMEHIDLELREDFHLPLEFRQADIRPSHVHHPPAYAETGPVHDAAAGDAAPSSVILRRPPADVRILKLPERLPGVPDAVLRHGLDMDAGLVDGQAIRLVFIQHRLRDGLHERHRLGRAGPDAPAGVLDLLRQRQQRRFLHLCAGNQQYRRQERFNQADDSFHGQSFWGLCKDMD